MVQGSWVGGWQLAGIESGPGNGNGILIQQSSLALITSLTDSSLVIPNHAIVKFSIV